MPSQIQRIPLGLSEVLGIFGGRNPTQLLDEVRATVELEQFLSRSQISIVNTTNPVLAEGGQIVHAAAQWQMVIAAEFRLLTTATMNGYSASIRFGTSLASASVALASAQQVIGYAVGTPAGSVSAVVFRPDKPFLLAPGNLLLGTLDVLGTDPTAVADLRVAFATFG